MDEASRGKCSLVGGGILHDDIGHILFAFSDFYDGQTNIATQAMEIGGNLHDIALESNMQMLVEMLHVGSCVH